MMNSGDPSPIPGGRCWVMVLHHAGDESSPFILPDGTWRLVLDSGAAVSHDDTSRQHRIDVTGPAVCVLVQPIEPTREAAGAS